MYRLGGVISYEANTYLQYYVLCNDDGDFVPSVTQVSLCGCGICTYMYVVVVV